jgi:hypothetical protein
MMDLSARSQVGPCRAASWLDMSDNDNLNDNDNISFDFKFY